MENLNNCKVLRQAQHDNIWEITNTELVNGLQIKQIDKTNYELNTKPQPAFADWGLYNG